MEAQEACIKMPQSNMNKRHFVMYNIITLKYNIIKYREVRKEERAKEDGFTLHIMTESIKWKKMNNVGWEPEGR